MAMSAFDDKTREPTDVEVKATLGRCYIHWTALREALAEAYPPLEATWGFTGAKYGWSLRLKRKKRAVVYLMPKPRHFLASTAFGEKAVKASRQADLSDATREVIRKAPRYPEGRAVRLEVRTKKDRDEVVKILAVKMSI